jgi:hypothetical protein
MVNRYNFAASRDDRIEKPPQVEKYAQTPVRDIAPKPQPKRGIPPVYARVDRNLMAVALIVAALAGVAYWAVKNRQAGPDSAETSTAIEPVTTSASLPPPLPETKPVQRDDSRLHLDVEVLDNAWVTLEADGKTVINAEMARGEKRNFEAAEAFRFRTIGNAAGLRLTLNGAVLPALGEDGEVIKNRVFDRDFLEKLRNEPAAQQTQS